MTGADDAASMYVTAALVAHGQALLPVLVAEMGFDLLAIGVARGARLDPVVAVLLKRGLTWVNRLSREPAPVDGWVATVNVVDQQLEIVAAEGTIVYVGTIDLPPGWRATVERYGWAVLYMHTTPTGAGMDSRADLDDLRAAADSGRLLGGRVRVAWWPA